jgi:hypothetical protein
VPLLEDARADRALDLVARTAVEDDGSDALQVQQVREK